MLAIWSLVPLPFLKPAWTSGSLQFTYCWSLAWRILSTTLLACEMSTIVQECGHSLALPFLGIGIQTDLFQFCGHCWVFQICWHIECSTFTASSFRIWNSKEWKHSVLYKLWLFLWSFRNLENFMQPHRPWSVPCQGAIYTVPCWVAPHRVCHGHLCFIAWKAAYL